MMLPHFLLLCRCHYAIVRIILLLYTSSRLPKPSILRRRLLLFSFESGSDVLPSASAATTTATATTTPSSWSYRTSSTSWWGHVSIDNAWVFLETMMNTESTPQSHTSKMQRSLHIASISPQSLDLLVKYVKQASCLNRKQKIAK